MRHCHRLAPEFSSSKRKYCRRSVAVVPFLQRRSPIKFFWSSRLKIEVWFMTDSYSWYYLRTSLNSIFLLIDTDSQLSNFLNLEASRILFDWKNPLQNCASSPFCSCKFGKHKIKKCQQNATSCSKSFQPHSGFGEIQDPNDDVEPRYPRHWHRGRNHLQPGCPLRTELNEYSNEYNHEPCV